MLKMKWENGVFQATNIEMFKSLLESHDFFKEDMNEFSLTNADGEKFELLMYFQKVIVSEDSRMFVFISETLTFKLCEYIDGTVEGWFVPEKIGEIQTSSYEEHHEWFTTTPEHRKGMEQFLQNINPKPKEIEREKILSEIQMRPGGRLWFELNKFKKATKTYTIELRYNGAEIEGMSRSTTTFEVNKTDFNDMVLAVEIVSDLLFQAECTVDEKELPFSGISLKMYSDDDVLFNSLKEFTEYKEKHRIETRLKNNWTLVTYINNIPYHGEIVEGMLVATKN